MQFFKKPYNEIFEEIFDDIIKTHHLKVQIIDDTTIELKGKYYSLIVYVNRDGAFLRYKKAIVLTMISVIIFL